MVSLSARRNPTIWKVWGISYQSRFGQWPHFCSFFFIKAYLNVLLIWGSIIKTKVITNYSKFYFKMRKALQDQQDVNLHLRSYIDSVLLNIMEKYPELLEVRNKWINNHNNIYLPKSAPQMTTQKLFSSSAEIVQSYTRNRPDYNQKCYTGNHSNGPVLSFVSFEMIQCELYCET